MGKKTKKEKILAEYHRRLQALSGSGLRVQNSEYTIPEKPQEPATRVINYTIPTAGPALSAGRQADHEPQTDYSYVLSDLKRIAFLTVLAICAQLVLWYRLGR